MTTLAAAIAAAFNIACAIIKLGGCSNVNLELGFKISLQTIFRVAEEIIVNVDS